jgi:hypothetical protein
VQTLRRLPHTFFDAYFSGRFAQDVCRDGSIFVDRDGEHFGHVLEYMRDGVVAVAEAGACPSVSLLRMLKREFGYYCIELVAEQEPEQVETVFVMGGHNGRGDDRIVLSNMEQYDATSGRWSAVAPMSIRRDTFAACVILGEVYVTGGRDENTETLGSMEKYSPASDTWTTLVAMPGGFRFLHTALAVGLDMYVFGGSSPQKFKYNSTQGSWSMVSRIPEPKICFAACVMGTDIYVFGGDANRSGTDTVYKYDTLVDEWSILSPMPHISAESLHCRRWIPWPKVMRFDPVSEVWSELASTSINRRAGASFVLGDCLYAVGGSPDCSSDVKRYDVVTDTWIEVANMLEGRCFFGAVTVTITSSAKEEGLFDSLIAKACGCLP